MNNNQIIFLFLTIFILSYLLIMNDKSVLSNNYIQRNTSDINSTNMGFVKPEHRLLHILNNISSGSKISLDNICNRYIYNKNTIDTIINERLTKIIKDIIQSINNISQNDFYIKNIENVYGLISCNKNQRYLIDFFIYDIKNFYTIRLIADIVIIDNDIFINYLNIQTGSNPTILNKYDIKFNNSGILLDGNMFKENIADLFDSYYRQSFHVIGLSNTSLEYTKEDLTKVLSLNSLKNMYFPSSVSPQSIKELENKDLSGYLEMYLPQNQMNIKSPSFCEKYKIDWDKYGIPNESDTTDSGCYLNQNSTSTIFNDPWYGPGLINNMTTNPTQYHWQQNKGNIISSL